MRRCARYARRTSHGGVASSLARRFRRRAAPARRSDRRDLLLLRHAERGAAAARGHDVRVLDLEAGALERLDVVDDRAADVREAGAVDEDAQPVIDEHLVVVALVVERERVLEPGAAAATDADAETGGLDVVPCDARNSVTFLAPVSVKVIIRGSLELPGST